MRLYRRDADYGQPLLKIPAESARAMKEKLQVLYGDRADACYSELERIMQVHYAYKTPEIIAAEGVLSTSGSLLGEGYRGYHLC